MCIYASGAGGGRTPPQWYGPDLGAPRRGQRKGPKITDSRGDLRKKSTKKGPRSARKGAQNHRGAEGQPRQDRKTSKNKQNTSKHEQNQPQEAQKTSKSSKISATSAHNHREGGGEAPAPAPNHYHGQGGVGSDRTWRIYTGSFAQNDPLLNWGV